MASHVGNNNSSHHKNKNKRDNQPTREGTCPEPKPTIHYSWHAVKHMREGSSIINTTSVTAYKGLLDYTSTKGAIVAFTRGLTLQLVNKGIRVNGVAPGSVWTPLIPASFRRKNLLSLGQKCPWEGQGNLMRLHYPMFFLLLR